MNLGETILSRRRALALTQEQVAERLGVTPQAVYKWEKGLACPDVQLLSPLARLLQTDLNTLFAYDTEPDNVELSALIERVSRLALQKDGLQAAFNEARAALRKYPASAQLRLSMAIVLEGALVAQGGGDEEAQREVEDMYRFAAKSEDARVRDAARGIRVRRLIHKGKLDEAEALLDALPDPPSQKWHYRAQLLKARGEMDAAAATAHRPSANPRCCGGNSRVTIASPSDWMIPLPTPCNARAPIRKASLSACAHNPEPSVNSASPTI